MSAQGRGGAGEIDPADQWVFNPDTGSYELRLPGSRPSGTRPGAGRTPGPGTSPAGAGGDRRTGTRPAATAAAAPSRAAARRTGDRSRTAPPRQRRPVDGEDRRPPRAGDRGVPPQRGTGAPRSRRRPRKKSKKKALAWAGGTLALLLITACTAVYLAYDHLNDNIDKVEVPHANSPAKRDEPVNILLIGTDQRTGEGNGGYGDEGSAGHADVTILLHFGKDRTHATALSIPRDMIVDIPDCETVQEGGGTVTVPGSTQVRFNESLGVDGRDPGCTWKTVEQLTGVTVNHFMMVDFNAVKTLSSVVGGVPVCLSKDINDPKSHLNLPAGDHVLEGEEALAFVRTRSTVGTGSDLSRIKLQQQFLGSLAREIKDDLTDPGKLWNLADAATKALTVDTAIGTIDKLKSLAEDLSRVPVKDITFLTVPVLDNPAEEVKVTVVLDEARALPVFKMLQEDKSFTAAEKEAKGDKEPAEGGESGGGQSAEPDPVPVAEVRVDIYNGGSINGAAQSVLQWLQVTHGAALATNAGNAPAPQAATTLESGPDQAGMAATLAELMGLPKNAMKQTSEDAGDTPMVLTLGDDFEEVGKPIEVPAEKPADVDTVTAADEDVCAG
ncbi:LCP family protein [Streptomyces aidingensis]|uniref:Cell envelope-related function transcriptional attenuator common domain-containing protein n=1 Tax=Streptomyces aidingensis TaxID=910347 RepID=A0A1I1GIX2_9ACTN|nr:LCP family protein [Streptomyces aidingensis]SFC11727.1 cell envelope-related function transcriptional attenuator common domain-containing protein [Streptomyces aidingensis]